MTGPNSAIYRNRANVEDMLALVLGIEDRRRCIFRHAWEEVGWDAVFDEARLMQRDVDKLLRVVQSCWCEIQAQIEAGRHD